MSASVMMRSVLSLASSSQVTIRTLKYNVRKGCGFQGNINLVRFMSQSKDSKTQPEITSRSKQTNYDFKQSHTFLNKLVAAGVAVFGATIYFWGENEKSSVLNKNDLPKRVPYLIIGAGTAGFEASKVIRYTDPAAKILLIGEESSLPYRRYLLSKRHYFFNVLEDRGMERSLKRQWLSCTEEENAYCQPSELDSKEKGVAVATGQKVKRLNVRQQAVTLEDGTRIKYDKCLIATGAKPNVLPVFENASEQVKSRTLLLKNIEDFERLEDLSEGAATIAVIGGGFLGTEVACLLGEKAQENEKQKVYQIFPERGILEKYLPKYLSKYSTERIKKEGVEVLPECTVVSCKYDAAINKVQLTLSNKKMIIVDYLVSAVGSTPNVELAKSSKLKLDPVHGGFLVNEKLQAEQNVWVAGDAASFYDIITDGRRRIEHDAHAVRSGNIAGENMTGADLTYICSSEFASPIGKDIHYAGFGEINSEFNTMAWFYKRTKEETESKSTTLKEHISKVNDHASPQGEDFEKGVVFYLKNNQVAGIVLWNEQGFANRRAQNVVKGRPRQELLEDIVGMFFVN